MTFLSRDLRHKTLPQFTMNDVLLSELSNFKYLGHYLTNELNDDLDIKRQCRSLYIHGNTIIRKFHMCSIDVKLQLFKTFCAPLYTAHLWWNFSKSAMDKMRKAYHNVLKNIVGLSKYESTSGLCAYLNVKSLGAVRRNLIYGFMCRIKKHK